ncbi:hypothetical protein M413DRAFT_440168, partial [Hebeloma cylindrosporum]
MGCGRRLPVATKLDEEQWLDQGMNAGVIHIATGSSICQPLYKIVYSRFGGCVTATDDYSQHRTARTYLTAINARRRCYSISQPTYLLRAL